MKHSNVLLCRDLPELSRKAANEFIRLANQSVKANDRFIVALSGGSTPKNFYSLLATPEFTEIPWPKIYFFWSDERCVPPDHPESNYRMVRETLLSKIKVPEQNVHRMKGEDRPELAAMTYQRTIQEFFRLAEGEFPRFDLILLGLGADGHTASLFPGSPALRETQRLVAAVVTDFPPPNRLTLTLPVINNAAHIIFLVAGSDKASALRDTVRAKNDAIDVPARLIQLREGNLIWLVDQSAARLL